METIDIQEEFKQILEFAIQRGNEQHDLTVQELVKELATQMKPLLEKTKV